MKKASGEVSQHMLRVWYVLKETNKWMTNREVADMAGVAGRTARQHTKHLADAGIVELRQYFPDNLYRIRATPMERGVELAEKLSEASSVMNGRHSI